MSLTATTGELKISGNSKGAVSALQDIENKSKTTGASINTVANSLTGFAGKFAGMATGIGAVAGAIALVKAGYEEFNRVHAISADLFSQFGNNLTYVNAKMAASIQDATDGMMSIQQAARSYNLIVNSSIGGSIEQVQSLGKAAVDVARKTGGKVDEIMQTMTDAVMSGKVKSLEKLGIAIDETNLELDAHIATLQKYGDTANENDLKTAKSKNILEEINKKYKEQIVTVGDVNEITAKYNNNRDRNAAISAKANENMAKHLAGIKQGWQDLKDTVTSTLTGIEYGTEKVMAMVEDKAMLELTDANSNYMVAMQEKYGDLSFGLSLATQTSILVNKLEVETNNNAIKRNELDGKNLTQIKEIEETNKQKLKQVEAEVEQARKLEVVYRSLGKDEKADSFEKIKEAAEGFARILSGNNKAISDAKLYDLARNGIKDTQKVLKETSDYIRDNAKTTKDYNKMSTEELEKAGDGWSKRQQAIQDEIKDYDTLIKLGKKLTPEEQARYNLLKKQDEEIKKQITSITKVFEKLTGLKLSLADGPGDDSKAQTPAWMKEYYTILDIIKKNDYTLNEAILNKFGSLDSKVILKKYQEINNEKLKLEKRLTEEHVKELEARSKAESDQKDAEREASDKAKALDQERLDRALEMRRGFLQSIVDAETEAANKQKDIKSKTFEDWSKKGDFDELSNREKLESVKKFYALQVVVAEEHLSAMVKISQQIQQAEYSTPEKRAEALAQVKTAEDALNKVREDAANKTVEIESKREKELKQIRDNAINEIKGYGENLVKNGAGALYDAMTISNAALKESTLSRSEMLAKALKDEMSKIAKEAAIKGMWESGLALASLATGDMAGFTAHGAAAAMFGTISGAAYLTSKAISAPSDSEIARRKEKNKESNAISNSKSGVSGATNTGTKIINIYWPNGLVIGDKDTVVRELRKAEDEAERRGQ